MVSPISGFPGFLVSFPTWFPPFGNRNLRERSLGRLVNHRRTGAGSAYAAGAGGRRARSGELCRAPPEARRRRCDGGGGGGSGAGGMSGTVTMYGWAQFFNSGLNMHADQGTIPNVDCVGFAF